MGDPNYYQRFGFRNYPEFVHEGIPQEAFLVLPFSEKVPQGVIEFHQGFKATSWLVTTPLGQLPGYQSSFYQPEAGWDLPLRTVHTR